MTKLTTILVPIRNPLTDQSARTLAVAGRLAHDNAPADLRVLHVNLLQTGDNTQTADLTRAISSTLDGVEASVTTRQGFLVEEVILEESIQIDAGPSATHRWWIVHVLTIKHIEGRREQLPRCWVVCA